jgi:thiamine biosynthesis lipoprotein
MRPARTYPLAAAMLLLGVSCAKKPEPMQTRNVPAMGTALSVSVPTADPAVADQAAFLVRGMAEKVYALSGANNPDSEISKLNEVAGTIRVPVSEHAFALLRLGQEYNQKTGGALDITTATLERLWGFDGAPVPAEPLSDQFLAAATRGVGIGFLRLHENQVVSFASPNTKVRLDELAAGYAVDLAVREIRNAGIPDALVNLGGRYIRCLGGPSEGTAWTLPLADPLRLADRMGTVHIRDGQALSYRRLREDFVVIAGETYGRVIDPRTGRPARGTAGVAVIGPTATEATALATALLVLGVEEAPETLAEFPRCSVLIIPDREPLELWMNASMIRQFEAAPRFAGQVRMMGGEVDASTDREVAE